MVPLVGLGLRDPAAGHCVIKFMHCTYSYVGLGRRHRKRDNHGTYPGRWLCSGWLETQAGSSFSTAAADCYMHQCGSLRNNASVCLMASSRMTDGVDRCGSDFVSVYGGVQSYTVVPFSAFPHPTA